MGAAQRVLVVDGLAETEEVLRAVLGPRGLEVDRVRGSACSTKRRPSVVVLHLEDGPATQAATPDDWRDVPRVLIGAMHGALPPRNAAGEHYLEKPFQYGELVRAIERLLDSDAA